MRYDHRYGYVSAPAASKATALGCIDCGITLGALGNVLGALGADCAQFQQLAQVYTRLSKKDDKKKSTRQRAAQMAADAMSKYNACMSANAAAAAQAKAQADAAAAAAAQAAAASSAASSSSSAAATPIPYVPIEYASSGGGYAVQETTPAVTGYCVNEQGVQVACPGAGSSYSGFTTPSGQQIPSSFSGVAQTNQVTSAGQPIYYDGTIARRFYTDSSGQRVYNDPATGQWAPLSTAQAVVNTGSPASTAPLTQVPYVQMPTESQYGATVDQSGAAVDAATGQAVTAQQAASYAPVSYVQMPGEDSYDQETIAKSQASGKPVNEIEFVGNGRAEYYDKYGVIRVLKLVIPKKATGSAAAATSTPAATAAPASQSIYGGSALPGGTMNVEDFTAQYALSGGWW